MFSLNKEQIQEDPLVDSSFANIGASAQFDPSLVQALA